MYKVVLKTLILFGAIILISSRAGAASTSPLPAATPSFHQSAAIVVNIPSEQPTKAQQDAGAPEMMAASASPEAAIYLPASNVPAAGMPGDLRLGSLSEIAWNNLNTPEDESVLAALLNAQEHNEVWAPLIARREDATSTSNPQASMPFLSRGTGLIDTFLSNLVQSGKTRAYCTACHQVTSSGFSTSSERVAYSYHPVGAELSVQCRACHMLRYEQAYLHYLGEQ